MSKSVDDFLGYGGGDVITMSDLQTQMEFDAPSVDFYIKEAREYTAENMFKLTCYFLIPISFSPFLIYF